MRDRTGVVIGWVLNPSLPHPLPVIIIILVLTDLITPQPGCGSSPPPVFQFSGSLILLIAADFTLTNRQTGQDRTGRFGGVYLEHYPRQLPRHLVFPSPWPQLFL